MKIDPSDMSQINWADIERRVEEADAKRAQRRKELHEKNIAADVRIVV